MPAVVRDARPPVRSQRAQVGIGWRQPHYAELLAQQPQVDFLEVHSENFFGGGGAALAVLEQGRARYPVSLHGVALSLGSAIGLDPWHLEQLANLVERIDPVRVSDHACFARGLYQGHTVHASDLLPIPFTNASLNIVCAHIDQVQARLRRPFMVENLSAYIGWKASVAEVVWHESEFLVAMARRAGCLLLVDVNNIYVNALNALPPTHGEADRVVSAEAACRDWLDAIDPTLVGELHLAGHCRVHDAHGEIVIDDHGSPVCEAVWRLFAYAVQRFGPVPTLIEWDTELPALQVLLDEAERARTLLSAPHAKAWV